MKKIEEEKSDLIPTNRSFARYPNKIAKSERIIRGTITMKGASCVWRYKDLLALC